MDIMLSSFQHYSIMDFSDFCSIHRWQRLGGVGGRHDYNHTATREVWGHASSPSENLSELDALRSLLRPSLDEN